MLTTMSLSRASSAGVAAAFAPCSDAQRSALPGVWVHTLRGKSARRTFAAIREPMIPRPRKTIRSTVSSGDISESSPTGRFDAQPPAAAQRARALAGGGAPAVAVPPGRPRQSAMGAARGMAPALGDQREGHLAQRLELAHHAVPAAVPSGAPGSPSQRILQDPQREFPLER